MAENITNEVLDQVIDSMPAPSAAAAEMLKESESASASESESEPTPGPVRPATVPPVPQLTWISEPTGDENVDTIVGSGGGERDSSNVEFDPRFHAVDEGGRPTKTKTGKFRKKRGSTIPPAVDAQAVLTAAIMIVSSIETLGKAIGGEEWKPEQSEHEAMVNAWRDYFMVSGMIQMPAYVPIIIATGAYAVPRLTQPKTSSRLVGMWRWFKRGWTWMF